MEEPNIIRNITVKNPDARDADVSRAAPGSTETARTIVEVNQLDFSYRASRALQGINLQILEKKVTAFVGPSGCGKSTLLRCFNRMNDLIPGARMEGRISFEDMDIAAPGVDAVALRR